MEAPRPNATPDHALRIYQFRQPSHTTWPAAAVCLTIGCVFLTAPFWHLGASCPGDKWGPISFAALFGGLFIISGMAIGLNVWKPNRTIIDVAAQTVRRDGWLWRNQEYPFSEFTAVVIRTLRGSESGVQFRVYLRRRSGKKLHIAWRDDTSFSAIRKMADELADDLKLEIKTDRKN